MRVPVGPPAKPGGDHGLAERLERAGDVDALAARASSSARRCGGAARAGSSGTDSDLSMAALRVTVMITPRSSPSSHRTASPRSTPTQAHGTEATDREQRLRARRGSRDRSASSRRSAEPRPRSTARGRDERHAPDDLVRPARTSTVPDPRARRGAGRRARPARPMTRDADALVAAQRRAADRRRGDEVDVLVAVLRARPARAPRPCAAGRRRGGSGSGRSAAARASRRRARPRSGSPSTTLTTVTPVARRRADEHVAGGVRVARSSRR